MLLGPQGTRRGRGGRGGRGSRRSAAAARAAAPAALLHWRGTAVQPRRAGPPYGCGSGHGRCTTPAPARRRQSHTGQRAHPAPTASALAPCVTLAQALPPLSSKERRKALPPLSSLLYRAEYIASYYAELRQLEKAASGAAATYTTPRTLLSVLRLSTALARLRFVNLVEEVGLDERCEVHGWF